MEKKIKFLKLKYEKKAIQWKNENDDRKLFSNIYFQIMEALEEIKECNNSWIMCAINKQIRDEQKTLDNILNRFE